MANPLFEQVIFCAYCQRFILSGPYGQMDAQDVCNSSTFCWPCQKLTFNCAKHKDCSAPGIDDELSRRLSAAVHQAEIDELLRTMKARLDSNRMQMQMCGDKKCVIAEIDAKYMRAISGK